MNIQKLEQVPIDKLVPYARNARTHSKEQILQLRSSLREFGFVNLTNLLTAKGSLIKKALGIDDVRIEVTEDKITFPWFQTMPEPDEVKAYTHFIVALCKLSNRVCDPEAQSDAH